FGTVLPEPLDGLGERVSRIRLSHSKRLTQSRVGTEVGALNLEGMVRLVPGHDDGLPLPVQQPADLFRETGVCPAIGINDTDWPKPLRRALGRGHHRRADTI